MPRKSRRLGPRWTIPGKLALKARWVANRPAMLARSKAGTEASRRTYADRLAVLRELVATWPDQLTMADILRLLSAAQGKDDRRNPASIVRRMKDHGLIVFDLSTSRWQNLCRVANADDSANL
jgi:uncharacterized protein YbjT (DUF2867 family)